MRRAVTRTFPAERSRTCAHRRTCGRTRRHSALGEQTSQTDARGVVTAITSRDTVGRVLARTQTIPASMPTAPAGLANENLLDTWTYDPINALGAVATIKRQRGTNAPYAEAWKGTTSYDIAMRPTGVSTTITEGGPAVTFNLRKGTEVVKST